MVYTKIIMGGEKFHFSGSTLVNITKEAPTEEHFCARKGCSNPVTDYKYQIRDCCSGHHASQHRAEKLKIKTGLRDPAKMVEVLNNNGCSIKKSAEYFKTTRSTVNDRMHEFGIVIKKTAIMSNK